MKEYLKEIRTLRLKKGYSQEQMGRKLNMVASAYGKIERGQTLLTLERLKQIAEILEFNPAMMMSEVEKGHNVSYEDQRKSYTGLDELTLARKIICLYRFLMDNILLSNTHGIMHKYPLYELFPNIEEEWDLLSNEAKSMWQDKEEFFTFYGGACDYSDKDKLAGFNKLMKQNDMFYLYKFSLVNTRYSEKKLWKEYISTSDNKHFPLEITLDAEEVTNYLDGIEENIFKPQNEDGTLMVVNKLNEYGISI